MQEIEVGSDYSGVGAFDQALIDLGIPYKTIFSCDMDKYARKSYIENYGAPEYFPENVYDREIPKKPLDIYMTSPPCQGFSLAGNRKGSILFLNSHEFIKKNKPRFFIFENVKGLLSHDKKNKNYQYGNTFNMWLQFLGGKSINGNPVIFPNSESVPYHIYHTVINAKHQNVPQNRERVFIVGIRDDMDNVFSWPKKKELKVKLKDVLEEKVNKKYFLSQKILEGFIKKNGQDNGFKFCPKTLDSETASCITARCFKMGADDNYIKVGFINQDSQASRVFSDEGVSPSLCAGSKGYSNGYVQIGAIRGRYDKKDKTKINQELEINQEEISNTITTVQKDNVVVYSEKIDKNYFQLSRRRTEEGRENRRKSMARGIDYSSFKEREFFISKDGQIANTITTSPTKDNLITNFYLVRKLTPRECFRLMGFPESYKIVVSDTQAYKQAGNSIVKDVLSGIISKLNL